MAKAGDYAWRFEANTDYLLDEQVYRFFLYVAIVIVKTLKLWHLKYLQ